MIHTFILILDIRLAGSAMFARKNSRKGTGACIAYITKPLREPADPDIEKAQHHSSLEATHRKHVIAMHHRAPLRVDAYLALLHGVLRSIHRLQLVQRLAVLLHQFR